MSTLPELRFDGLVSRIDLIDLDDDVRQGRLPASAELRYPPWTGEAFVPLGSIPELGEAFDAPTAAFAQHMRARRWPWASLGLTLAILLAGVLQGGLIAFGGLLPDPLTEGLLTLFYSSLTGWEPLVLDGAWWSAWGSQFVHSQPSHLLPNLAVLGYAGFRVERAMGPLGFGYVAAASVLGGALAVTLLQPQPVMGSSILGFGVWGAQLAIGFRMGDAIPQRQQRYYGFGNLLAFIILFAGSLRGENVSHWAHAGGFVGGVVAAMWIRPPLMLPRGQRGQARRRQRLGLLALLLAPCLIGPALRAVPALAFGRLQRVEVPDAGLSLELRARLLPSAMGIASELPYPKLLRGLPHWYTLADPQQYAFAGVERLSWSRVAEGDPLLGDALAASWERRAGGSAKVLEAPPPLGPGWTAQAIELCDGEGGPCVRLEEHHLLRGRYLLRAGLLVDIEDGGRLDRRAELFAPMISSLEVGDPPQLAAARAAHARSPTVPRVRQELAVALWDLGDLAQADALFDLASQAPGAAGFAAAQERLAMWVAHPQAFSASPEPAWFEPWLEEHPLERRFQLDGVRWLAEQGRCLAARAHHEAFANARPDAAELVETGAAVLRCEGEL